MSKLKIKYQIIPVTIADKGGVAKFEAYLDKLYKYLTGLMIVMPYTGSLFGSKLKLKVNGEEIFAEDFQARFISHSENVAIKDKFYEGTNENPLKEPAENSLIEGTLTDGGNDAGVTYPYTASLVCRLENFDEKPKSAADDGK